MSLFFTLTVHDILRIFPQPYVAMVLYVANRKMHVLSNVKLICVSVLTYQQRNQTLDRIALSLMIYSYVVSRTLNFVDFN
jgi:hypothetical protein